MGSTPALPLPPGTQSDDVANAVPDVHRSTGERVMGGVGALLNVGSGDDFAKTPLGQAIGRHHEVRLANARRHYDSATTLAAALAQGGVDPQTGEPTGIDPSTQQPMTPEQRQQYKDQLEGAWGDYQKIAGVSPEAKQTLEKHKGILDFAITKGHEALQKVVGAHQQAAQAAGQTAQGAPPTPPPSATGMPNAGTGAPPYGSPGDIMSPDRLARIRGDAPSAPLPPPPQANPQAASGATAAPQAPVAAPPAPHSASKAPAAELAMPAMREDLAAYQSAKHEALGGKEGPMAVAQRGRIADQLGLKPGSRERTYFVATGSMPPVTGMRNANAILPTGDIVPVLEGPYGFTDLQGNQLPDGSRIATAAEVTDTTKPHPFGYMGPNGEHLFGMLIGKTRYGADAKELPADTKMFDASLAPTTSTTESVRMVQQPDGSTVAVPVTSTTTRNTGSPNLPGPPKAGASGGGRVVGGRVPTEVKKAEGTYNAAQERYNVMADALPRALKGDQQAMLNMLANHIGMTMGLQKGARITQAIYGEAENSSPVLARFLAKFDKNGQFSLNPADYRGGVVLTPDQMRQMIDLAEVRLNEDKASWDREIDAARSGYGMGKPSKPNAKTPPPRSGGTVTMRAPNGQQKAVPADQVEHYKSMGATVVQ